MFIKIEVGFIVVSVVVLINFVVLVLLGIVMIMKFVVVIILCNVVNCLVGKFIVFCDWL